MVLAGSLAAAYDRAHILTHWRRGVFLYKHLHTFPYAHVMYAQSAFSQRNQQTAAWKSARKMAKPNIFVGQKCRD
jgi:hypothetical protein